VNAKFSIGKLTRADGVVVDIEMVSLSGGHMGKDEMVRPATDDDRYLYAEEYAEFLSPPLPPASDGASSSAAVAGADAVGAGDMPPPSAG